MTKPVGVGSSPSVVVAVAAATSIGMEALSNAERHRAESMSGVRLAGFVSGRRMLRETCAELLDVAPDSIDIGVEPSGRPFVRNQAARPLHLSVSYSGELVAIAASLVGSVGIDVEGVRRVSEGVRRWTCSEREMRVLAELADVEQESEFIRLWTMKEAYLKESGRGIRERLSRLHLGLSASRAGLTQWRSIRTDNSAWITVALRSTEPQWARKTEFRVESPLPG
ncbi:4'-phosphopantetheinyl transferase family protein [Curtobacterium flaccumfaciens]|uniref:4'-phosphopantetheinyl transferase family protein n=1 Tax=Curtobacterium flaccumfaciens TaxID=2035 RepID=UPI0015FF6432|nr:4'-phosphopantetheinyl transferase superfamily protein [Curtobacterium flaccumfaciens]MBB1195613.1 4'-phosphopantetheinyl transferase superfamily protein [Curtobacterium flaccumfaciens]